jgi:hypothetical protein
VDSPPRLGPPGAVPPVGPLEDPAKRGAKQGPKRRLAYRPRARMCLLKGCESWFEPECPQQRYCPGACVDAAGAWSAWKARSRYRESPMGRRARQKGNREYRTRRAARETREGGCRGPARQRASPVRKLSPLPVRKLPALRPRPSRGPTMVPASTLVSLRPTRRFPGSWSLLESRQAAVPCRMCRTGSGRSWSSTGAREGHH